MKVVKKTDDYTILQRRDNRYAVIDSNKKPVNGDEKVKILVTEELLKVTLPAPKEEEAPAEEAPAEEAAAEDSGEATE